jgi:hypothetical protein
MSIAELAEAKRASACWLPPEWDSIWRSLKTRMQCAKKRCENPNDAGFKTYGARGVRFLFPSVREAVLYILKTLPHPSYKGVEIDRIDNNRHYEPGNLQLSTRRRNANNRYTTFWVPYRGTPLAMQDFLRETGCKYSRDQVKALVEAGLTGEQILVRWETARHKPRSPRVGKPRGRYKKRACTI